jgi:hypothetical protein
MKLGRQAFAPWFLEGKNVEAVVRGTVNIKPAQWFLAHPGRGPGLSLSPVIMCVPAIGRRGS